MRIGHGIVSSAEGNFYWSGQSRIFEIFVRPNIIRIIRITVEIGVFALFRE